MAGPNLTARDSRIAYYNAIKHIMQSYGVPVEENLDYNEELAPETYWGQYVRGQRGLAGVGQQNSAVHIAPDLWTRQMVPNVDPVARRADREAIMSTMVHEMGHSAARDRPTGPIRGMHQEAQATAIQQLFSPLVARNLPGGQRVGTDYWRGIANHPYRQQFPTLIDTKIAETKAKLGASLYPGAH